MRPQSIVQFERVVLLIIVVQLVGSFFNWEYMEMMVARQGMGSGVVAAAVAISIGITLLLLWLIARRRSVVAMWIYVAICAFGILTTLLGIGEIMRQTTPSILAQAAQLVLTIVSIWLLFRADSRAWFRKDATPAA
ncbi:MAG TPA: hypothetical protein VF702_07925 [Allosphingosinicella sp.]|jgi:hypothetical protein